MKKLTLLLISLVFLACSKEEEKKKAIDIPCPPIDVQENNIVDLKGQWLLISLWDNTNNDWNDRFEDISKRIAKEYNTTAITRAYSESIWRSIAYYHDSVSHKWKEFQTQSSPLQYTHLNNAISTYLDNYVNTEYTTRYDGDTLVISWHEKGSNSKIPYCEIKREKYLRVDSINVK